MAETTYQPVQLLKGRLDVIETVLKLDDFSIDYLMRAKAAWEKQHPDYGQVDWETFLVSLAEDVLEPDK